MMFTTSGRFTSNNHITTAKPNSYMYGYMLLHIICMRYHYHRDYYSSLLLSLSLLSLSIYVYTHMYMYMYMYRYIYIYIYTYIHTYIHACMHTYIHTYIHTLHTYMCIYIYIYSLSFSLSLYIYIYRERERKHVFAMLRRLPALPAVASDGAPLGLTRRLGIVRPYGDENKVLGNKVNRLHRSCRGCSTQSVEISVREVGRTVGGMYSATPHP